MTRSKSAVGFEVGRIALVFAALCLPQLRSEALDCGSGPCETDVTVTVSNSTSSCTYRWPTATYRVNSGHQPLLRWSLPRGSSWFNGVRLGPPPPQNDRTIHLDNEGVNGQYFEWLAINKNTSEETFYLSMSIQTKVNGIDRECTLETGQGAYTIVLKGGA